MSGMNGVFAKRRARLLAMKAIRELGLPLSANVRLLMGTDEESGSGDIAYYYSKHPFAPYAFTPDADFPVIHIEKGHYHPSFGKRWAAETALPRVTGLKGGFRTNVVPPEAECVVSGGGGGRSGGRCHPHPLHRHRRGRVRAHPLRRSERPRRLPR